MNYPHLLPQVVEVLSWTPSERILWMKEQKWFGYPKAIYVLNQLEEILAHPRVYRMPNRLVIGRTNNGKTSVCQEFLSRHPVEENPDGEHIIRPVVLVECPAEPSEVELYMAILRQFHHNFASGSRPAMKGRVLDLLQQVQTRVLILDELHNLANVTLIKQHQLLTAIKTLGNELRISLVGAGDERLPKIMSVDAQLENRFELLVLPKWKRDKDFRQLLATIERVLPLKEKSELHRSDMATLLYAKSQGTIGELLSLLKQVAQDAILSGAEKITLEGVHACSYVSPSDRKTELANV